MIDDFSGWNEVFRLVGIFFLFFAFSISFLYGWIVSSVSSIRVSLVSAYVIFVCYLLLFILVQLSYGIKAFRVVSEFSSMWLSVFSLFGVIVGSGISHVFNMKKAKPGDSLILGLSLLVSVIVLFVLAGILFFVRN